MSLGSRLKDLRVSHHMKQSDLGNLINVSGATISSWETDRTEPNIGMIEALCGVFDCTKSELLDENWKKYQNQILKNFSLDAIFPNLSGQAIEVALSFDKLDAERKARLMGYVEGLISDQEDSKRKKA